jgi:hypothetical protein
MLASLGTTDWLVIAAAVAAILWVNWYFFLAERSAAPAAHASELRGEGAGE